MGLSTTPSSISGGRCCFSSAMELRWATKAKSPNTKQFSIPVFVSTNPSHVKPTALRDLFSSCNRSCDAFPNMGPGGRVGGRVDIARVDKLQIALNHSPFVVSVFCNPLDLSIDKEERNFSLRDLVQQVAPSVNPYNGRLVGFGRAISDLSLTASIYDVMVIPSLQRMGIGRMIVQRIVRLLTSKDIYDIAALCTDNERQNWPKFRMPFTTPAGTREWHSRAVCTVMFNSADANNIRCSKNELRIPVGSNRFTDRNLTGCSLKLVVLETMS